jgi:hypothetical protein
MLTDFTTWLFAFVGQLFTDVWAFVKDAAINVFDLATQAIVALIAAIPAPDFLSSGLATLWGNLPASVQYFSAQLGVPAGLAVIGAGFVFRLTRKLVTLGQW